MNAEKALVVAGMVLNSEEEVGYETVDFVADRKIVA